jgi:phage host-nuclease inhibitor protein Gam
MIRNAKELAVIRKQLGRIERALESLRQGIENPRQFAVLAEGYVDQIAELKAEIDSYRSEAHKKQRSNGQPKNARKRQKT